MEKDIFDDVPNVLYDLRQTYAINILTPILVEIEIRRRERDYEKWFELLTDHLFTNINQKLADDEIKEYNALVQEILTVINQYPDVYCGRDKRAQPNYLVKESLKKLEMWLKKRMDEAGLYGKGSSYDVDEI